MLGRYSSSCLLHWHQSQQLCTPGLETSSDEWNLCNHDTKAQCALIVPQLIKMFDITTHFIRQRPSISSCLIMSKSSPAKYDLHDLLRLHRIVKAPGMERHDIISAFELIKHNQLQALQWKEGYLRVIKNIRVGKEELYEPTFQTKVDDTRTWKNLGTEKRRNGVSEQGMQKATTKIYRL